MVRDLLVSLVASVLVPVATTAAAGRFGWGWAWLIRKNEGALAITSSANQDKPLMNLSGIGRGSPLLGPDVWEHAYTRTAGPITAPPGGIW